LISTLGKTQRFTKEELKSMLMKGALYKESMKQVNELLYDIGFTAGVIR
ncbi:MAG: hypothetical protein GY757_24635, partial [bacterium]|nr:hypothetical protein [bacterium]